MKARILVVAPYPIKNPMHGGQKRVQALVSRYRELSDEVSFVAVYLSKSYTEAYKSDIAITDTTTNEKIALHPEQTDIIAGAALSHVRDVKTAFVALLKKKKPDVVHIEQPYMVEHIVDILKEINMKCVIVFGSQNVEYEMKRNIYKSQLTKDALTQLVKTTKVIEARAVEIADVVIAVSRYDLNTLTAGYKFKTKFVIPNGIEVLTTNIPKTNEWNVFKLEQKVESLATFVGSAHPPNFLGFKKLLANIQIPSSSRIVIAGGVGSVVKAHYQDEDELWKKVSVTGELSKESLRALLYESDIILLPILNGGGSNLKTAEAIISGKKIVATEYAFRGFEKYLTLPNIYIANSPKTFEKALVSATNATYISLSLKQRKLAQAVTWPHALINLKFVLYASYFLRVVQKLRL